MEMATNLVNRAMKSMASSTEKSPETLRNEKRTVRLFEVMRLTYLDLWTKRIGTEKPEIEASMRIWTRELRNMTDEDIMRGLDAWESKFPPNVKEFKAACSIQGEIQMQCHKRHQSLSLPKPRPSPDLAVGNIKAMRQIL